MKTKQDIIDYCLTLPATFLDYPFAKMEKGKEPTPVLKHLKNKKMFALVQDRDEQVVVAVKIDPAQAEEQRELFEAVSAAWHMNKTHWSDIRLGLDLDDAAAERFIKESYDRTL